MTYQCIVDSYLVRSWVTQHHDVDSAMSALGLDSTKLATPVTKHPRLRNSL